MNQTAENAEPEHGGGLGKADDFFFFAKAV